MSTKHDRNGSMPGTMRILAGGLMLFSMGIACGILAGGSFLHQEMKETAEGENPVQQEEPSVEMAAAVRETTVVEWITAFSLCGHECVVSDTESAVGMTTTELQNTYRDYELRLFTGEKVKLKREVQGWCPEHFVLTKDDGVLCVMKTDAETMLPYKVTSFPDASVVFPQEEQENLEIGIPFDSLSEIDMYFEGIDS